MNNELLRHIEILKTIPEVKESIEELIPWCIIFYNWWNHIIFRYFSIDEKVFINTWWGDSELMYWKYWIKKIIWQVEERHLRMFLQKKIDTVKWCIRVTAFWEILLGKYINWETDTVYENLWSLDNSKSYMEQSEEFFKKLNYWIVKEFNIKL